MNPINSFFDQESYKIQSENNMLNHIIQMNDKTIISAIKQQSYHKALSLLNMLKKAISEQKQQNCSRMKKYLYHYQLTICYFNFASVYQKLENQVQTANHFEKAIKNFQSIQGYITNRQQTVSFTIQLAKLHLQFCSILSQNSKHSQAITHAQKSLQKIVQCFRILQAINFQLLESNRLSDTSSNSKDNRNQVESINFKSQILFEAERMLKELSKLPQPHEFITRFKSKYESLMHKMFFWKNNSENNEKRLRKELQIERKKINNERNILGVQKFSIEKDLFTIEKLTTLQAKLMRTRLSNDAYYLLSNTRLTELAFYSSVIYFTMATQIRFSQVDLNFNQLKIDEKFRKLNRDERILKCKMIHMKAIEIAGMYLPEKSEYFVHILNRFNKNYMTVMDQISQQSKEISIKSIRDNKYLNIQDVTDQNPSNVEDEYGISRSQMSSFQNQTVVNSLNIDTNKKLKKLCCKIKKLTLEDCVNENSVGKKKSLRNISQYKEGSKSITKRDKQIVSSIKSSRKNSYYQSKSIQKSYINIPKIQEEKKDHIKQKVLEKVKSYHKLFKQKVSSSNKNNFVSPPHKKITSKLTLNSIRKKSISTNKK